MSLLDPIKNLFAKKQTTFIPPMRERRPWNEVIPLKEGGLIPEKKGMIHEEPLPSMPDGVDLSALWEEPNDPSSLSVILAGASAVLTLVVLLVVIFK